MSRTTTYPTGPGRLEDTTFKVWVSKRDGESRRIHARLEGTVPVFCGWGDRHDVEIRETLSAWTWIEAGEVEGDDEFGPLLHNAFHGSTESATDLMEELEAAALEGWSDPCDEAIEEMINPVDRLSFPQREALAFAFGAWVDNLWDDQAAGGDHDIAEIAAWGDVASRLADNSIPLEETGILDHLDSAVDAIWIALGGTDPHNEETSDVWPELNLDDLAGAAAALGIWEKVQAEQGITPGDKEIGGILPSDIEPVWVHYADPADEEIAVEDLSLGANIIDTTKIPMISRTAKTLAELVEAHLIEYSEGSEGEGTEMSLGDFGLYLIGVAEMGMEERA